MATNGFGTTTTANVCNLCARILPKPEKLTKDHVPIKSAHPFFRLYKQSLIRRFGDTVDKKPRRIEQKGVIFETICANCNNDILGSKYDPAITQFMKDVECIANLKLITVSATVEVEVRPLPLAKALLGHLMAARGATSESNYDRIWRHTVLDPALPIPKNVHIYYWFYPYPDYINVFRDVAVRTELTDGTLAMRPCSLVSCFPIGFLVSDLASYEGLLELTGRRDLTIADQVTIPLRLTDDFGPFWPLQINGEIRFLSGQSGMGSVSAELKELI